MYRYISGWNELTHFLDDSVGVYRSNAKEEKERKSTKISLGCR